MAKITKQSDNFSKWYTDVILDADLADYGPVKGTMVVKPYGFSLWTNIRDSLNKMIKTVVMTMHIFHYSYLKVF